jgi:hypothetical protein
MNFSEQKPPVIRNSHEFTGIFSPVPSMAGKGRSPEIPDVIMDTHKKIRD